VNKNKTLHRNNGNNIYELFGGLYLKNQFCKECNRKNVVEKADEALVYKGFEIDVIILQKNC
jgi:hypothetical protein